MTEETQGGHLAEEATKDGRGWRMDGHVGHFPIPGVPFGYVPFTNVDDLTAVVKVAKKLGEIAAAEIPEYFPVEDYRFKGTKTQGTTEKRREGRSEGQNFQQKGEIGLYSILPDDVEPEFRFARNDSGQLVPGCPAHVFDGNKHNPMRYASPDENDFMLRGRLFRNKPINEPAWVCTRSIEKDPETKKATKYCPEGVPVRFVPTSKEETF